MSRTVLVTGATGTVPTALMSAPEGTARTFVLTSATSPKPTAPLLHDPGRHHSRTYTLTGPRSLTSDEVAGQLSLAVGRPITYLPVGDDAKRKHCSATASRNGSST